jgi:ribosomal-protein-alanine N-acetyltransferase
MGISPRPATEDDLEQVSEIERMSISPPWSREAFRAELEKSKAHFWVVTDDEDDDRVLAYAVFALPGEQAHLQTIAVRPEYRKKGIATYLLRQIISFVMRQKADSIVLEVRRGNFAAVQLYQSLGFVVIHTIQRFYPDGEDAYSMIYKTEREKLTGDPVVDFEMDPVDGKKNFN